MRRPHPYLAIAAVALAVVLVTLCALACPAAAQVARPRPSDAEMVPYVNGFAIYPGSPECARKSDHTYVPTQQRVRAIRYWTIRAIEADLDTQALTTPLALETRRLVIALARDLEPRFVERRMYATYTTPPGWTPNCGVYWCGCASGAGTWPPQIATDNPPNVEALVSWELTNAILGQLQRSDLWDTSSYVGGVTRRVEQWLGGWQQNEGEPNDER